MASFDRPLQHIRILTDGRPGHENQSAGLAAALARRCGATVETVRLTGAGYFARFQRAAALSPDAPLPDLLIGAGHATHLPLKYAAHRFGAKSVVIMEPTWPKRWFDLCLVPEHDLEPDRHAHNVIPTRGALNRIPEAVPPKQPRGLILVGGPSRHHGWDGPQLLAALREVLAARPDLAWTIGDSRRTPAEFTAALAGAGLLAELVPHARTTPAWVPGQLLAATEVWVTEDSISMMHEAVTAGARTGLLPVPVARPDARVLRSVQSLLAGGFATTFADWQNHGRELPVARPFHETARCAEIVLQRIFPQLKR